MTESKSVIKAVHKILSINENMLLKDFLTNFLQESLYNHFSKFYDRLYNDLKLEKFYKLLFGLDI